MSERQEFEAELLQDDGKDVGYLWLPFSVPEVFGIRGMMRVRGTINGIPYRSSIMSAGDDRHCMGLTREFRREAGLAFGQRLMVTMERDTAERTVEVPEELALFLDREPRAREFFESLSFTNRKEYVAWVSGAKKEETRRRRLEKVIPMLLDGVKHP